MGAKTIFCIARTRYNVIVTGRCYYRTEIIITTFFSLSLYRAVYYYVHQLTRLSKIAIAHGV